MESYTSYTTATKIWDIPCIETVIGHKIAIAESSDVTVFKHNERFRANGKMVHSCELALPADAIKDRNGIMVASPELLFLEFSSELDIHRLILLGLQLCSHQPGQLSKAITTKERLDTFLANTSGHRGHRKAIRAVKYVENGSASIMESLTYMILTLPYSLGGYGLDKAILNYKIGLSREARKRLGQNYCFVDMYYKQAKLAVEYDSFTFHSSPAEQGKDIIRAATLERQGIDVMHLSTIQLYDREACRDFAHNLASRLGKRINIRTKSFVQMHSILRGLLPTEKSVL